MIAVKGASPIGTVGGGKLEATILANAKAALAEEKPHLAHYRLTEKGDDAIRTLCGGEAYVFVRPFLPPPRMTMVGGAHVGRPLKAMAETAGFEVIAVDVEPGRQMFQNWRLLGYLPTVSSF